MSFFVVVRAAADDTLRLLDERAYERRGQALDAVREALAAGLPAGDECFVCDLDAAAPVLVTAMPVPVSASPVAPTVSEPMSVEVESLVSEEPLAEAVVETAEEPIEAPMPVVAPADDLAAALRRATASLAAEAPTPAAPAEVSEETEPVAPDLQELADALEQLQTPADEEELPAAEPQQEARVEWPWLVEQQPPAPTVEAPVETSEPAEAPSLEPVELSQIEPIEPVELSPLEPSLIVPLAADPFATDEASSFMPRPVVLGEYGEDEPTVAPEPIPEAPAAPPTQPVEPEPLAASEPAAAPPVEPVEPLASEPVAVPETAPPVALEPVAAPEPPAEPSLGGYEGGEDDLSRYTCHDCVYENTCPKAGASAPAECGTFQWKSV